MDPTSACSFRDLVPGSEPPPGGPPVGFGSSSVVYVNLELRDKLDVTNITATIGSASKPEKASERGSTCDGGGLLMGDGGTFCFYPQPSTTPPPPQNNCICFPLQDVWKVKVNPSFF